MRPGPPRRFLAVRLVVSAAIVSAAVGALLLARGAHEPAEPSPPARAAPTPSAPVAATPPVVPPADSPVDIPQPEDPDHPRLTPVEATLLRFEGRQTRDGEPTRLRCGGDDEITFGTLRFDGTGDDFVLKSVQEQMSGPTERAIRNMRVSVACPELTRAELHRRTGWESTGTAGKLEPGKRYRLWLPNVDLYTDGIDAHAELVWHALGIDELDRPSGRVVSIKLGPLAMTPGFTAREVERIDHSLHQQFELWRACYESALDRGIDVAGTVALAFTIGVDGDAVAASAEPPWTHNAVDACLVRNLRANHWFGMILKERVPPTEHLDRPVEARFEMTLSHLDPASSDTGDRPPAGPLLPSNVPPSVLAALRISGETRLEPDEVTRREIRRAGKTKVVAIYKVCIDVLGVVSSVDALMSSGFPAYDATLRAGLQGWRHRPWMFNGQPTPVCSPVTFLYSLDRPTSTPTGP